MVNILYCGNDQVFDGMLTSALSVLKRTTSSEPFCFYIFTMDVTRIKPEYNPVPESLAAFFLDVVREYNPENDVNLFDLTEMYEQEFGGSPNESAYCSPYTLLRLLADLVPEIPDKLLYLDADIMFNRDVHLLWDTDLSDAEYAGAPDHYGKFFIRPDYINAGVLLFNINKVRETGLLAKSRELIRTKKWMFADQDAIFHSTQKKIKLAQRFNDQKFLHRNTVIRHFSKRLFWLPYPHTENIKQWNISKIHRKFGYYCFDDILYEYIYLKEKYERSRNKAAA